MTQFKYEGLAPVGGPSGLKGLAEMMRPKIASMLPKHITPERMLKALFLAASKTPALFSCTQESLIKSLMDASSLGLDCSGTLGSAYLVPFQNRKKNVTECQLIPGYRGLIDLARRSNEISSIEAHPVYAQDQFEVSFGTNPVLVHKPYLKPDRKPQYICFYAVATLKDGSKQIEVMTLADVEKIRGMSKMGTSGPWKDHFGEMGRKTVVRRIVKYLPMSAELEKALQLDNEGKPIPRCRPRRTARRKTCSTRMLRAERAGAERRSKGRHGWREYIRVEALAGFAAPPPDPHPGSGGDDIPF